MNEELVTRALRRWLTTKGWTVLVYDYPGSGTGKLFRCPGSKSKNAGGISPDVLAVSNGFAVLFENKADLEGARKDSIKLETLRNSKGLLSTIGDFCGVDNGSILLAIGVPEELSASLASEIKLKPIDLLVGVSERDCNFVLGTLPV